jgi:hypothetical protein
MRTWVKITLAGLAVVVVAFFALGATGAYFALRHMEKRSSTEADALREVEAVRTRFGARPPLVELGADRIDDIRINRLKAVDARPVTTIHVIAWKSADREMVRLEMPLWLMRFSTLNLFSQIGVGPERLRLTVQDIERYGPGIVLDYGPPGADRVFLWVD